MKSADMTKAVTIECLFEPVDPHGHQPPKAPKLPIRFAELDGAADALLIGFPELVACGISFSHDCDGNIWVEFKKFGFSVMAEGKLQSS